MEITQHRSVHRLASALRTMARAVGLKISKLRLVSSTLIALISVIIIWYPFGFSLGGTVEEWDFIHLLNQHPDAWNSFPGRFWSETFAARPLQLALFYLAHAIDTQSFFGFHLVLIGSCLLRVIAGCSIGFWLFRQRGYALILGALFLVFPADTQQINFRTLNISVASTMMFVATALNLVALTRTNPSRRLVIAAAATVISCAATLVYEASFALYALVPLLVLARFGINGAFSFVRRTVPVWLVWIAGPVLNATYLWYAIVVLKSGYEADLLHGSSGFLHNTRYLVTSGAYRVFFDSWRSIWNILADEVGNRAVFVVSAIAVVGLFAVLAEVKKKPHTISYLLRVLLCGALMCIAGYLPYVVSEAHMVVSQRTFLGAAAGASVIFVAGIALIFRRNDRIGVLVGSILVFAGLVSQLYQHDQYAKIYIGVIRPYLANVADRIDPSKRVHLITDHSGLGGYLNGIFRTKVTHGIAARLGDTEGSYFLCMNEPYSIMKPFYHCNLEGSAWIVVDMNGAQLRYPKSDVDVVDMGRDFDSLYQARSSKWSDLGSFSDEKSLFNRRKSPDSYHCRADSEWGYSRFCRGEGWAGTAPVPVGFRHENSVFLINDKGTLFFDLVPTSEPYSLRISLQRNLTHSVSSSLKIEINGAPLQFSLRGRTLSAVVPSALLVSGLNEIAILNPRRTDALMIEVAAVDLVPQTEMTVALEGDVPEMPPNRWFSASNDEGYALLAEGFSDREYPRGVWTDGDVAVIRFKTPSDKMIDQLDLEAIPYLDETHPSLDADVVVNRGRAIHLSFALPAKRDVITIPLAVDKSDGFAAVVEVTISIRDPRRPLSADPRYLGLFVERLRIR
jgi:hypothetical protein